MIIEQDLGILSGATSNCLEVIFKKKVVGFQSTCFIAQMHAPDTNIPIVLMLSATNIR